MPTYRFHNPETDEHIELFCTIAEMEEYEKNNPHLTMLLSAPLIHSGRGLNAKPDESFRDILREVKKKNSKGISQSTINTF